MFSNPAPPSFANHFGGTRRGARGPIWLVVALLACAAVAGRVSWSARIALHAGQAAHARADDREAVRAFQRAVRLYVPGSPFVAEAVAELRGLAGSAADQRDWAGQVRALQALRAGLLGARSLYTPFAAELAAANDRLAELYAQGWQGEDPGPGAAMPPAEQAADPGVAAWHLQRLARLPGAGPGATALFLIGFALWLGAAVLFTRRGIDRTLALRRNWAVGCLVAFVVGLTLFVSSLWLV
jgi:hypothetical protein